jgi:hypothetical protein
MSPTGNAPHLVHRLIRDAVAGPARESRYAGLIRHNCGLRILKSELVGCRLPQHRSGWVPAWSLHALDSSCAHGEPLSGLRSGLYGSSFRAKLEGDVARWPERSAGTHKRCRSGRRGP